MKFPNNFLWGGAISAIQSEGAFLEDGKGISLPETFSAGSAKKRREMIYPFREDVIYPNQTGVDHYHRFEEDIRLMAEGGFKAFRMSISWGRIYPTGEETEPNRAGVEHYKKVFKTCRKYGIEPIVTMLHFDIPLSLVLKYGGWENKVYIQLFEKYGKTLLDEFHEDVHYWLTINEINAPLAPVGIFPDPSIVALTSLGTSDGSINTRVNGVNNQFIACALVSNYAHNKYPNLKIGCMLSVMGILPLTCDPLDILNHYKWLQYLHFLPGDVMLKGRYPYYAKSRFQELGVDLCLDENEKKILEEGTVDFVSFSYYDTACLTTHCEIEENPCKKVPNPYLKEANQWATSPDPIGLRYFLNIFYDHFKVPLFVVENGRSYIEEPGADGMIHDNYRIKFLKENIEAMKLALADGVDIIGYTMWSPFDIISAASGEMRKRYGLIYVDRDSQGFGTYNRKPKDSYYWYKKVIESQGEDLEESFSRE